MPKKKKIYEVLSVNDKYTIAEKKRGCFVVNDGVCGYYMWNTIMEARKACRIINTSTINKDLVFKTEDDAQFFRSAETDFSEFASYLLTKSTLI